MYILAGLFVVACACGPANSGDVYSYEETPLYVHPGQCVNFAAKFFFLNETRDTLRFTWKKDTHRINNTYGKWLNITYAKASDSAFYQAEVKTNLANSITEETLFWLNVQACKSNEKEVPGSTTECKSSCVEMCPSGWRYFSSSNGDRCYKYFAEPKSWLAARDACQNIGSQLAIAGNDQENSFIGGLVESAEGSWIGLNDRLSESTFVWNYEKTNPYSFSAWASNEPNNYNAKCNIENCVVMSGATGRWADVICNSFYPFVCQGTNRTDANWKCDDAACQTYYRFYDQLAMWHDAKKICKSFGAKLVEIDSKVENDFVRSLALNKDFWIGLNDIAEAGSFVWNQVTYNGRKPSFKNWAGGEPNDMVFQRDYSEGCDGEDCVILKNWQSKTQWYDFSCSSEKPYVCEKNRNSLFSAGLLIGIVLGSMIGMAVTAGIVNAAIRRRNRSQVKEYMLNAFERENLRTYHGKDNLYGTDKKTLRWKL